ncbi:DNA recombination protein RmuC [Nitrincola iocasae]|uniref:DNA recombination protein RmuC n=1 Tax=Nitrincola iocasae TaxID=2614693 RepID=A0A5J6LE77_9GAMM|nr:DNA recombination protein RmuC [Nitrincola iocasae]QEW06817.1 DNA recombination protein RmuC [Nitrincola iocasae]
MEAIHPLIWASWGSILLFSVLLLWLSRHSKQVMQQQLQHQLIREQAEKEAAQEQLDKADLELDGLKLEVLRVREQNARLTTQMEERQRFHAEQLALLQNNREQLRQEFETLANEVLERKGESFRKLSQQGIQQLLNPLHQDMKGFREKVESIHTEDLKQRSELKTELIHLQQLNQAITGQAEKLTNALQGQKKVQGNWGELILENVLDSAGLRAGKDYRREVSFATEEGRRRPDVVIYLPEDKHLVIDAKTSLAAYTRYVNAETDTERQLALSEHAAAVSARIRELSDKRYYQLPGLNTPEIVVMFIPVESAYVEALRFDQTLYQRAIESNVLVATPTTLLTSLNIVRQLWRFEDQSRHTAELARRAERFYNKLRIFLDSMQGIGVQLDKARETYDKAFSQLYSGRGNLIRQAAEFKELGVSVQQELDAELVDKARLELGE